MKPKMEINLVTLPSAKLTKENYKAWCASMRNYFLGQDLWEVVENFTDPSSSITRKNDAALRDIRQSCDTEALSIVENAHSAKDAWDQLAKVYGPSGSSSSDNSHPSGSSSSDNSRLLGSSTTDNSNNDAKFAKLCKAMQSKELTVMDEIIQSNSSLRNAALLAAVSFGHLDIVKKLVASIGKEELKHKDTYGYTALARAAKTGRTEMAKCMISKNDILAEIPNKFNELPVTLAVLSGNKETAHYLYSVTPMDTYNLLNGLLGAMLLNQCFLSNNLDLALHLLQQKPDLGITLDEQGYTLLWALAGKPSVFPSGCQLQLWQRWIYYWIQIDLESELERIPKPKSKATRSEPGGTPTEHEWATNDIHINIRESNAVQSESGLLRQYIPGFERIYNSKLAHELSKELLRLTCKQIGDFQRLSEGEVSASLRRAARCGIPEFIEEVMNAKPHLSMVSDKNETNLFFEAVQFRQAEVFNLIYGYHSKNAVAGLVDNSGNNLLHMAAKLAPSTQLNQISGAALQMQRELQWFKEVEQIVQPALWECINEDDHKTARILFTEKHKCLAKEGENWMKQTATSGTVVAALIVTIMFAASITVPGGNDQEKGYPIFHDHKYFKLFIMADAISLFSSTTSLLMFLGILTSRYAEDDFLKSLPLKLIIGLSMLFISVATMMISFFATISAILPGRLWIIIPVISFAVILVFLFFWLLFPLFLEIYVSTYGSGIFKRNTKPWI